MNHSPHEPGLRRELTNRHIQLIALGGAIGTGLFLGSASVLKSAGPSMILGYAIGGAIAFMILRQLGEMIVQEPVAGSFSHFAHKYWGDFPGFLAGWNYWVLYILAGMAELTAIGTYIHFWWPSVPTWVSALTCFIIVNGVNMANVKAYGETEFWFAIIKVAAVVAMIVFGGYLLVSGHGGPQASVTNIWRHGGFAPHGVHGLLMALGTIMLSYAGLELIGITAAEAKNPRRSIPKAVNQVVYRIFVFYICSLAVLLCLYPWDQVAEGGSPFVMIFSQMGSNWTANVLNIVVVTAALSVYNNCVFATTRTLFGLARQCNAPLALAKVARNGVPYRALFVSSAVTSGCVLLNYAMPSKAFSILMAIVAVAVVMNWALISITHLKSRKAMVAARQVLVFRSPWFPYSNYVCLAFMAIILVTLAMTPDLAICAWLAPVWLLALRVGHILLRRSGRQHSVRGRNGTSVTDSAPG
ncbi:amino acid permease [Paraburkholderia aspalathi]|uniref:amino acid permease n=1 Tax=Paraburkholderia aspalathi TaxID=1324617 RepID=UPI0038BBA72E